MGEKHAVLNQGEENEMVSKRFILCIYKNLLNLEAFYGTFYITDIRRKFALLPHSAYPQTHN